MSDRHAGDTLPELSDTTGTNLTGASSVTVHVVTPSGTLISRAAVVAVGTTGAWSLPWLVTELDTPGVYTSEVQVDGADGSVQTFPGPSFRVVPQLDGTTSPPYVAPISIVDNGDGTVTVTWS